MDARFPGVGIFLLFIEIASYNKKIPAAISNTKGVNKL
jgi:hypothetical protein